MALLYPAPRQSRIVVTPEMESAFSRVALCHSGPGQMVAVVGPSGAGKTTSMRLLSRQIEEDCDAKVQNAWRTLYYVTADLINAHRTTLERHVLAQMLSDGLGLSVDKDLRRSRPEDLRHKILLALRQRNVQMVFIDEAGLIPALGLNALANLVNTAEVSFQWPLTIVLVGMNNLPITIRELPQVERRVIDTIFFQPYGAEEALEALAQIEPFFESLNHATEDGRIMMEFLTSPEVSSGGMLGIMIQLVQRTSDICQRDGRPFSLRELRMVHHLSARDRNRAVEQAQNGWRTQAPATAHKKAAGGAK
jgi:type II secretory pathway predicted ATPase ExeA